MAHNELKKGMKVRVYEDPITCKRFEEMGTLVRREKDTEVSDNTEFWLVEFHDGKYLRWINKDHH